MSRYANPKPEKKRGWEITDTNGLSATFQYFVREVYPNGAVIEKTPHFSPTRVDLTVDELRAGRMPHIHQIPQALIGDAIDRIISEKNKDQPSVETRTQMAAWSAPSPQMMGG